MTQNIITKDIAEILRNKNLITYVIDHFTGRVSISKCDLNEESGAWQVLWSLSLRFRDDKKITGHWSTFVK